MDASSIGSLCGWARQESQAYVAVVVTGVRNPIPLASNDDIRMRASTRATRNYTTAKLCQYARAPLGPRNAGGGRAFASLLLTLWRRATAPSTCARVCARARADGQCSKCLTPPGAKLGGAASNERRRRRRRGPLLSRSRATDALPDNMAHRVSVTLLRQLMEDATCSAKRARAPPSSACPIMRERSREGVHRVKPSARASPSGGATLGAPRASDADAGLPRESGGAISREAHGESPRALDAQPLATTCSRLRRLLSRTEIPALQGFDTKSSRLASGSLSAGNVGVNLRNTT